MADFQAHINQAQSNLSFLAQANTYSNDSWDWQVTVAYYVAVHIVNAHLAKGAGLHYTTHEKVKNALFNSLSPVKVDQSIYLAYHKLENLSRRSRYLCIDTDRPPESEIGHLTFDKHLKKALQKLDVVLEYFCKKYNLTFPAINIDCIELKSTQLNYFKYVSKATAA